MVTALVMTLAGVLLAGLGALGISGRVRPLPSPTTARNLGAQVLLGGALAGLGLIVLAQDVPAVVALLVVPTVVLGVWGLYAVLVRPPRWLRPRWDPDADRTPRRRNR